MGRYMIGRQCVKEQGNTNSKNRQGRKLDRTKESVQNEHHTTITRSTGENGRRAPRNRHTDKSSASIKRRSTLNRTKKARQRERPHPMALIRQFAHEASIGRTVGQQSTNNSLNLLTASGGLHELVALHSPLEPPGKEEHVHLEQGKAAAGRQYSIRSKGTSCTAYDPCDHAPGKLDRPTTR